MRDLRDSGAVGAIGLGVNETQVVEEVLEHADFDLVLLAGRYTLLEQGPRNVFTQLRKTRCRGDGQCVPIPAYSRQVYVVVVQSTTTMAVLLSMS